ncbi:hypothetical protein BU16DRAFT_517062 [Lophium mytilinum]|uniref:EthD domain-containing protein n=1 Tax=Lophium mytilinum TaxID=390894 RepID=A0A6A6QGB0_9PEZI|nr:hypothetical protein BU16DRAFT_517062 [Lophium mytilinum]
MEVPTGPGIIVSRFKLRDSSEVSQELLEKWYDEVHIPDVLATGGVKSAWRWKAADPEYGNQNMVLYKLPDLTFINDPKFQAIGMTSDLLPGSRSMLDFTAFDLRFYTMEQLFQTEHQPEDATSTIVWAAMEPAEGGAAELDSWYRDEHNQQMSKEPGWKRTTRFKIVGQLHDITPANDAPSFLTIHEFGDGHKIGTKVLPLEPKTEWTKKVMGSAKTIDAGVYHKVKSFGKAAA